MKFIYAQLTVTFFLFEPFKDTKNGLIARGSAD